MKIRTAFFVIATSVALTAPVLAHHSRTMFDSETVRVLRGKVVDFDFVNPHAFIVMAVENEDGSTTTWELEGGNAMGLIRNGWRPNSLREGDMIEVNINPLRSGAPGGEWHANEILVFESGSEMGAHPLER